MRSPRRPLLVGLLLVALLTGAVGLAACEPAPTKVGAVAVPLSTSGGTIVDAKGAPVVLAGVNWFGFETETHVVHGLWTRGYDSYLDQIAALGYNTIRLPWSVAAIRSTTTSSINTSAGANADLAGKTPLEAMDVIIDAAADRGLMVLLDNHRLNDSSIPELWYGDGYSEQDWLDAWTTLAHRYADRPNVIGADLKNEPHGAATWGTGDLATDWRLAAERAGNAIGAIAPDWLIVVEGIGGNVDGQQLPGHWWGGNLEGVGTWPVRLDVADKLVYSPHEYGPGVYDQAWFHTPDLQATLLDRWEKGFAYLAEQGIAPVLVGEFGGREVGLDTTEGQWQNLFVDFLAQRGYSWTYWAWNPNSGDTGGILQDDWTTVHADKQAMLDRALAVAPSPPTTVSTTSTASTTTSTTTIPVVPGSVTASFAVTSDWGSGYCGDFSIANGTASTVTTAGLRFKLVGAAITSTWNGTDAVSGATHTVVLADWARTVEAGATESSFGYCADRTSGSGLPTNVAATT